MKIEYALDDSPAAARREQVWHQMRIAHLHQANETIAVGIYACSPVGRGFRCRFDFIEIDDNHWQVHPES